MAKWLRRPPPQQKIWGSISACAVGDFSGSSHTSDFKNGTPVATLPGAWRYRVSTGTGRPGDSILRLGKAESVICNFYLSVAELKPVLSRSVPEILKHVAGTLIKQPTNTPGMSTGVVVWEVHRRAIASAVPALSKRRWSVYLCSQIFVDV